MTIERKMLRHYEERFKREHKAAQDEFLRLSSLFKDVCWYNFETACQVWRKPWRNSDPESLVLLHGMCFTQKWRRNCLLEEGKFPLYYEGPVETAPKLPPEIVLLELLEAKKYMQHCETQLSAPYDWAPGGSLYKELVRTTLVGKQRHPPAFQCVYDANKRKFSSMSCDGGSGGDE